MRDRSAGLVALRVWDRYTHLVAFVGFSLLEGQGRGANGGSERPVSGNAPGYIGPYRLLNVIHTGHGCQIWQAYDDANGRKVGVKIPRPEFRKDRPTIASLRHEYKVGRHVVHPRVLEMLAYKVDRGTPYLAMEWFTAPNMKEHIRQGIQKIAHLLPKIVEQAAEGLSHFNERGWVHRDVKPDNFLVSDQGEVKLIDFALARRLPRGLGRWLPGRSRKIQGTRSYMAPEQIRGEEVDQRADVYSFGCTIYELIVGNPPFTGVNSQELLQKHLKSPPPVLRTVENNITPELAQLVRRCLAKAPRDRPPTMGDFLREYRRGRMFLATSPPSGCGR